MYRGIHDMHVRTHADANSMEGMYPSRAHTILNASMNTGGNSVADIENQTCVLACFV